jgi:hypothetical protein
LFKPVFISLYLDFCFGLLSCGIPVHLVSIEVLMLLSVLFLKGWIKVWRLDMLTVFFFARVIYIVKSQIWKDILNA